MVGHTILEAGESQVDKAQVEAGSDYAQVEVGKLEAHEAQKSDHASPPPPPPPRRGHGVKAKAKAKAEAEAKKTKKEGQ